MTAGVAILRLFGELRDEDQGEDWLQFATIDPAYASGRPKLTFDGDLNLAGTTYEQAVDLDGSGDYISTPDSNALDITGDIDIRVRVAANDWANGAYQELVSKRLGSASEFSLRLNPSGLLELYWYDSTAAAFVVVASSVAPALTNGATYWLRGTRSVVSGNYTVKFFTSTDAATWAQVGTDRTGTTGAISATTAPVLLGAINNGNEVLQFFAGTVYAAEVRNGIDGAVVASFDAKGFSPLTKNKEATDDQGNVWTLQGDAHAVEVPNTSTAGTYAYLDSYVPTASERVVVARVGSSKVILGGII